LLKFDRKSRTIGPAAGEAGFDVTRRDLDAITPALAGVLVLLDQMAAKLQKLDGCFSVQPQRRRFEEQRLEI